MSDRDWDRELADLDRRLASVPDPPPTPGTPAAGGPARAATIPPGTTAVPATVAAPLTAPATRSLGTPAPRGRRSWRAQLALLLRVLVGVAVVAALIYWPYSARCGIELGYYLGLVALLGIAGVATSTSAWRHRSSVVHLLGLAMLAGAVTLGAREVLPKVGYAVPSLAHPATWTCTP